jgi:hypothetical protein
VFLAHPLTRMELSPKAMKEKALEGRTPTRVRFDVRTMVYQPSGFGRSPCRFVFCPTALAVGAINDG